MLTSLRPYPDRFTIRFLCTSARRIALIFILAVFACTKQELPDLGPRLPQTAAMEFSPSLLESKGEYTDNCGHLQIVDIGSTLQDVLLDAANRTFTSVVRPGSGAKPDVVVRVNLVQSTFKLRMDGVYDRAETEIQLGGLVSYVDQAGTALGEQDVQVVQKGRVRIMPVQKNCDYLLDSFIQDAVREFANKFSVATRAKLGTSSAPLAAAAPAAIPVPVPARPLASGVAPLSFKATVLDDNSNLVFEGGERIRVRVDVVNT
ncbi:MAG TPA: hypothetical protein VFQ02_03775, partial [Nitrospira sp.]|nr:hypothetical protein [Nitrospira sp.]